MSNNKTQKSCYGCSNINHDSEYVVVGDATIPTRRLDVAYCTDCPLRWMQDQAAGTAAQLAA